MIGLLDFLQTSVLLRWLGVDPVRRAGFRSSEWSLRPASRERVSWFHASSFGELEMLRPLIDDFIERGEKIGVSIFSSSAIPGLPGEGGNVLFAGLSPREGEWEELFQHFNVSRVFVSKYDLWPGLVRACAKRDAPLVVLNAEGRRSVRWTRRLFDWSGEPWPRTVFFANPGEQERLRLLFPLARILSGDDPRSERVFRRMRAGSSQSEKEKTLQEFDQKISDLPRPIGIAGSIWPEDLGILLPAVSEWKGSLLVVPHSLRPENLQEIRRQLERNIPGRYILVERVGILVELYSRGEWAFVGGGFGKGIHSTLEPAIQGLPLASGPRRVSEFRDAVRLQKEGILTVCHSSEEVRAWLKNPRKKRLEEEEVKGLRQGYRALLEECLQIR